VCRRRRILTTTFSTSGCFDSSPLARSCTQKRAMNNPLALTNSHTLPLETKSIARLPRLSFSLSLGAYTHTSDSLPLSICNLLYMLDCFVPEKESREHDLCAHTRLLLFVRLDLNKSHVGAAVMKLAPADTHTLSTPYALLFCISQNGF